MPTPERYAITAAGVAARELRGLRDELDDLFRLRLNDTPPTQPVSRGGVAALAIADAAADPDQGAVADSLDTIAAILADEDASNDMLRDACADLVARRYHGRHCPHCMIALDAAGICQRCGWRRLTAQERACLEQPVDVDGDAQCRPAAEAARRPLSQLTRRNP